MQYSTSKSTITGIQRLASSEQTRNKDTVLLYSGLSWQLRGKELPVSAGDKETQVQSLGQEDPLEEGMATHSSILAWRIPWTEEPGGLQSMGLQRVTHN